MEVDAALRCRSHSQLGEPGQRFHDDLERLGQLTSELSLDGIRVEAAAQCQQSYVA